MSAASAGEIGFGIRNSKRISRRRAKAQRKTTRRAGSVLPGAKKGTNAGPNGCGSSRHNGAEGAIIGASAFPSIEPQELSCFDQSRRSSSFWHRACPLAVAWCI